MTNKVNWSLPIQIAGTFVILSIMVQPAGAVVATSACLPSSALEEQLDNGVYDALKQSPKDNRNLALVIGNNYENANQAPAGLQIRALVNPEHDAVKMRELLTARGYVVVCILNATKAQIEKSLSGLNWILSDSHNADIQAHSVVYFAGHGGETADGDWIIPADFDETSGNDHQLNLVNLEDLLSLAPTWDELNPTVFIVDACRTVLDDGTLAALGFGNTALKPFARAQNRASSVRPPFYTLIFSTEPGEPASDGPNGGDGPFVQELTSDLDSSNWTQPADPTLWGIVRSVDALLMAAHVMQRPIGPIMTAGEDYALWDEEYRESAPYYLWTLGLLYHNWNRHTQSGYRKQYCGQRDYLISQFGDRPADPGRPWIPELLLSLKANIPDAACSNLSTPRVSQLDPGVADAVATAGRGTSVRASPSKARISFRSALGIATGHTQSRAAFDAQNFKLDCSSELCTTDRVLAYSDTQSIYLPSTSVRAAVASDFFAVPIDAETGNVLPSRFGRIIEFLRSEKQSGKLGKLNIKLVSPVGVQPQSLTVVPRAFFKTLQLADIFVDRIGLRADQVSAAPALHDAPTERTACSTYSVTGLCLLIEVTP